jgi:hypothetical protein
MCHEEPALSEHRTTVGQPRRDNAESIGTHLRALRQVVAASER